MDYTSQIDLALNTDFDPSIFDCWDDAVGTRSEDNLCKEDDQDETGEIENDFVRRDDVDGDNDDVKEMKTSYSKSLLSQSSGNNVSTTSSSASTSATTMNDQMVIPTVINPYLEAATAATAASMSTTHALGVQSGGMVSIGQNDNNGVGPIPPINHSLIPQSIQPMERSTTTMSNQSLTNFMVQGQQPHRLQPCTNVGYHQQLQGQQQAIMNHTTTIPCAETKNNFLTIADPALIPLAYNAALTASGNPTFVSNPPMTYYHFMSQEQQNEATRQHQQPASLHGQSQSQAPLSHTSSHDRKMPATANEKDLLKLPMLPSQGHPTQSTDQFSVPKSHHHHLHPPPVASASVVSSRQKSQGDLPPFLLFDAPIELRANFIQSQRQHGLTPMQDNNSLHYGMAMNGLHPQQTLSTQTQDFSGGFSRATISTTHSSNKVKLIDGRHGNVGSKRVKNAREQKRTQKIADLIDELRVKMERGGWKVGLKSKFHTLSSCAEYVKHLVQVNIEKEEALSKARADLEQKKRKLEEDEKAQQDPSDPESTTSSLTVSTGSVVSEAPEHCSGNSDNTQNKHSNSSDDDKNRKKTGRHTTNWGKKPKLTSHESSLSSTTSSGGDGKGSDNPDQPQGQSVGTRRGAMGTSISDLTDSNRGGTSSSEGNSSGNSGQNSSEEARGWYESPGEECDRADCRGGSEGGTGSVSSDAAVARGQDNQGHETCHADVVVTKVRKQKLPSGVDHNGTSTELFAYDAVSNDATFQFDYEEVFLNSNVPQILATTSGRIVAWNDFFLRVTGLSPDEVERLTFFSLVPPQNLSSLFEIVATSLRTEDPTLENESSAAAGVDTSGSDIDEGKQTAKGDESEKDVSEGTDETKKKLFNYSALTLPCVTFEPALHQRRKLFGSYDSRDTESVRKDDASKAVKLFMTVTLMADEDPLKRCFHCIFTDYPGTKGSMGSVTPDLLAHLFSKRTSSSKDWNSNKRRRHHRTNIG